MLRPSRVEYYYDQSVKQLVRTRTDIKLQPSNLFGRNMVSLLVLTNFV